MKRARRILCLAVLSLATGIQASDVVIAEKGKTDYQVVLPDDAPSPEIAQSLEQVARLMQTAFKANGFEIPVVRESARDQAKPGIFLGNTAFAQKNGVDASKLENWNYVHKAVGRDIVVAGLDTTPPGGGKVAGHGVEALRNRIGTAKAAADFLRIHAGVRFLYPDTGTWNDLTNTAKTDWMKSPAVEFLPTPLIRVPSDLERRHVSTIRYNTGYAQSANFYDLANNRFPIVDDVYSGHTYHRAAPPKKHKETHPEYFALVGGKRLAVEAEGQTQYCISNPEFQELVFRDLIEWLDKGFHSIDLGQPDGFRACQCKECNELYGTGNDWNEKLWIFHRNIAERVQKERPGKQVNIMSYINTRNPPKSFDTFPPNVGVILTGTNEEDFSLWNDRRPPRGFSAYLYNWCANLGTRYTPMRTPRYVEAQVKRLIDNNVQSIYRDGPGVLYGLEGPVYYTMGRMFDDPKNNDAANLVNEFCSAAFGKAGGAMTRFYDQLYHGIALYSDYLGTRCPAWSYVDAHGRSRKYLTDPFQMLGFLYTPKFLASLEKDLAQAESLADTTKVKARLALVRREFDYIKHLAQVIHLYHAFEVKPDLASRDRLLDAIDERNAFIESLFAKNLPDWSFVPFPIPGHNQDHLRLASDGYQEPFKDTCVNWNTADMRKAPLPGANRLAAPTAKAPAKLEGSAWDNVPKAILGGLPQAVKPSRNTTAQVLSGPTAIQVRIECELPAEQMKNPSDKESLVVYLAPATATDVSYRFTVGLRPESKSDAASGFITDVMDPRYGEFDPDWSGEWTYETKLEPETNRWIAMFSIPYSTLGASQPVSGAVWRCNIGRIHVLDATRSESSIWSATPATKDMNDRSVFGEMIFGVSDAGSGKSELEIWREKYNAETGEIPKAWKTLANPLPTPLDAWTFHADPLDKGVAEKWFTPEHAMTDWIPVKVPGFWAETEMIGNYQGYGWYRISFTLPENWKGKAVRIRFAGVDEQAWVYLNGKLIKEHTEKSEGLSYSDLWETPFDSKVGPDDLLYGKTNVLAVRVLNTVANGGIWRPVLINAE